LNELVERHEFLERDYLQLKDNFSSVETERDDLLKISEKLRIQVRDQTLLVRETKTLNTNTTRELESTRDKLAGREMRIAELDSELQQLRHRLSTREESNTSLATELEQLREELRSTQHDLQTSRRQHTQLQESMTQYEYQLTQLRSESSSTTTQLAHLERERDSLRHSLQQSHSTEETLRSQLSTAQSTVRDLIASRDRHAASTSTLRAQLDDVTSTLHTWQESSSDIEHELEQTRAFLHEAKADRELAITARREADRERDEAIRKLEQKGKKDLEAWEAEQSHGSRFGGFLQQQQQHRRRTSGGSMRVFSQGSSSYVTSGAGRQQTVGE
jgi:chromosome segregation ATPase